MAVAAVKRTARDAREEPPAGPLTRQALEGFVRAPRSPTPPPPHRRGQAPGLTADECDAILATCTQRRRTGRGLDEREEVAERRGLADGAIVGLLSTGRSAAARWRRSAGPTSTSPTARTSSSPSPARMSGAWSAAARPRSNDFTRRRGSDVEHGDGDDHGGGQRHRRPRQGVDGIGRGERRGRRDWRCRRRRR